MKAGSRLSRIDWTDAALGAMAAQGTTGVNVEKLARDLDTTKGSFYHHFTNRDALLEAALDRFLEIVADDLSSAQAITDPRDRLIEASVAGLGSPIDGFVDLALAASADQQSVAVALQQITSLRLKWLASTLVEAGVDQRSAQERAEAALATYLGLFHLQRALGTRFEPDDLRQRVIRTVDAMLKGA